MPLGTPQPFQSGSPGASPTRISGVVVGASDELLIVRIATRGTSNFDGEVSSLTLDPGGSEQTIVNTALQPEQEVNQNAEIWEIDVSGVAQGTYNLDMAFDGSLNDYYVEVLPASGLDATVPRPNGTTAGASNDTPTITVTGLAAGDVVLGVIASRRGGNDLTVSDGTEDWDVEPGSQRTFGLRGTSAGASQTLGGTLGNATTNRWAFAAQAYRFAATGPAAPTGLQKADGSDDQVTALEWTNGETYDSVNVHRYLVSGTTPGAGTIIETITGSPAFRNDPAAPPDTQVYYVIEGVTAAGSAFSPELAVYTPPRRPTSVVVTPGPGGFTVESAVLADGGLLEVWLDAIPFPVATLNTANDFPWVEDSLQGGTQYTLRFRTVSNDFQRQSGFTTPIQVTTGTTVLPPAEPSNVVAVALSPTDVRITWQDNSANEDGFRVFRDGIQVHETAADVVEWTDPGRTPDTEYTYLVRSFNAAGPSGDSNAYVVRTPAVVAESAFVPQAILF